MSTANDIELVRRFMMAWNARDVDAIMAMLSPDIFYHNIPMEPTCGTAAVRATVERVCASASEIDWIVTHIAATGDGTVLTERIDNFTMAGRPVSVPVMGRIAAGVPISAIQNNTHDITVPAEMIGSGEHYALEVKGDSMIDAGILDGDTVIIRNASNANPGDIIVALVDDEEATLKRFRRRGASIALEAANPAYETRIFGPDRVKIQGKLVGLIRRYH